MNNAYVRRAASGMLLVALAAVPVTLVATTISVDSVTQRWPWSNKVDITYTVTDGQDVNLGIYARIVFTANIGGVEYTINGVSDVGANASSGTHTVTWVLPSGLKAKNCTMTATILAADNPSGDDYMVIDLATGSVAYEGLLSTQEASNERYNQPLYKTSKLVLRKVPAGGPYPTGAANMSNNPREWTTEYAYYIGVFPVTQSQYATIYGSNPSVNVGVGSGDTITHRPVDSVKWDDLRLSTTTSTSSIPAVASNTGTFLQRLNFKTGIYFDLPTEVMFEIAQRAGATTAYSWGTAMNDDYAVSARNSGGTTVAVGSKKPNSWGLYDTAGNIYEWCLDVNVSDNMADHQGVFTPAYEPNVVSKRLRGGGNYSESTNPPFLASSRTGGSGAVGNGGRGFRISTIIY